MVCYRCEPRVDSRAGLAFTWRQDKKTTPTAVQVFSAAAMESLWSPVGTVDAATAVGCLASRLARTAFLLPSVDRLGAEALTSSLAPDASRARESVCVVVPLAWSCSGAVRVASVGPSCRSAVRSKQPYAVLTGVPCRFQAVFSTALSTA